MDTHKIAEYTEIAVKAIIESMAPNKQGSGDYTRQAIYHYSDADFRSIIGAAAKGFELSVADIGHNIGIVLVSDNEHGPFSPNLSWISTRLGSNAGENRDELRCVSMLSLIALLSEAFPTLQTTQLGWSSPSQFTVNDVLEKLHQLADDIIEQTDSDSKSQDDTLVSLAQIINENRIPKYPQDENSKLSVLRSESEMIKGWIRVLEEHGLLVSDVGYQEEDKRWMASDRLKIYIAKAGMPKLVEKVLSVQNLKPPQDNRDEAKGS